VEKTQKAKIDQQFEMARALLSILPKLGLSTGQVLRLIENPQKLEEILSSVLQVYLGGVDVFRLRSALGLEIPPVAQRLNRIIMEIQKADARQLFRLASVLVSIIPNLDLTNRQIQTQVENTGKLKEVLGPILQVPGDKEIAYLKNALGLEFAPAVRRYLEDRGYVIVDLPRRPVLKYDIGRELAEEVGGRLLEEDERFERIFGSAREVAWVPNVPLVPSTAGKIDFKQKIEVDRFSALIQEKTHGWARAVFPNLEAVVYLLQTHSLNTGEFVFSQLWTRVYNFWDKRDCLVVGMYVDEARGPIVNIRDTLFFKENKLGVLQLIVPC